MPWARNLASGYRLRLVLEHSMNTWPMRLAFLLRIGDAGKRLEEAIPRIDDVQIGLEPVAERVPHDLGFALAHQSVIDVDARDLRADRFQQIEPRARTNRRRRIARR